MTEIHSTTSGVEFVRTPDARFDGLVDFPYEPSYVDVEGLRMAYVDEGPRDGPVVLLLHGEPSWSYLYRRMIPPLVAAGYRCIAPDLIGFGRSDKPIDVQAYTYNGHVAWLHTFLDAIDLPLGSHLFVQDWGGLLGLRLVAERPDQFDRVAIGNTALPIGESLGPGFDFWLEFSQSDGFDDIGALFGRAIQARQLTDAEIAGYGAPFPEPVFMAGAIAFPTLVPITPDHGGVAENRAAWDGARTLGSSGPHALVPRRPGPRPPRAELHRSHSRRGRPAPCDVRTGRALHPGRPRRRGRRRAHRLAGLIPPPRRARRVTG